MPHPKETKRVDGRLWHLEDSGLTKCHAEALAQHLRSTEDKHARVVKTKHGKEVWWSKKG